MLKTIKEYWDSLLYLFYPDLCIICNNNDREVHDTFCFDCYTQLPFTYQGTALNNDFMQHFVGKIDIQHGAALFYFVKQGMVQSIIQELKYKNKPQYAIKMGEIFGASIKEDSYFKNIDAIVPVPLYKSKENKRGYNQSLKFAEGISKVLSIPIISNNLIRIRHTSTQTKMTREERLVNLKNAFTVENPHLFEGKHLLLVDDVLTTGTTLLECGKKILECRDVKISMATIAMGELLR